MAEQSLALDAPPLAARRVMRPAFIAVLALLLLNQLLAFTNWWPTPAVRPDHRLAPEFVWLWVILLLLVRHYGRLPKPWLGGLSLGYLLLVFGRYIDTTAPALFGRDINLYWDGAQIPRFLWVAAQDSSWWASLAMVTGVALACFGLYRIVQWGIDRSAALAAPYALAHRWTGWLTGAAVVLVMANHAGLQATWPVVSKPVVPTYWRQAQLLHAAVSPTRRDQILPPSAALNAALARPAGEALAGLAGRDVYLIVLESYGMVAYDHPRAVRTLGPARDRFAADLAAAGQQVVSAVLRAPTFGGASDLSHLSLLSGLDLSDPLRHDVLLTSDRPTLNTLFRAHGYETFGFYPSLYWDWPERRFYAYERVVDGPMLDYPGPALGPWAIPDQYAAARFEQKFPRTAGVPPRFVFFPTITSHFPFSPKPPYQPDWTRLLGDAPYEAADIRQALAETVDWLDMLPGYVGMIDYTYQWLGGYLRQPAAREAIYILVGDHQPTANVSGEGASWDVPVHIVSADGNLLQRFVALGFTPGLTPQRSVLGGLHDLTAMLLQVFAKPA